MPNFKLLSHAAASARIHCIEMANRAKESHLSSALSCIEILTILYGEIMQHISPCDPAYKNRDRFFMSKGHGVSALYAVMAEFGHITINELATYGNTDGRLPNHPCKHALPILECSSGSLGHGLGIAAGTMLACRLKRNPARAFVLLGDGETNEGSIWEAAMFAAAQKLGNLIAIVDHNNTQAVGANDALTGFTSLQEKFSSFGWDVFTCRGNDAESLYDTLSSIPAGKEKPTAVIANTTSGAGVSFMERDQVWFYRTPRDNEVEAAIRELSVKMESCK